MSPANAQNHLEAMFSMLRSREIRELIRLNYLRDHLRPRHDLLLENLALRQQILVLRRDNPKPEVGPTKILIGSTGPVTWPLKHFQGYR